MFMLFVSYNCATDEAKENVLENQLEESHGLSSSAGDVKLNQLESPNGLISSDRAVEINQNWNQTRAKGIANTLGIADNQSVQFSLEEVHRYSDYAEYEAKSLGYAMDGVRLYFAAYGENETNGNAGMATLFFVSTGSKILKSEDTMFSFNDSESHGDIPGASGMNMGSDGALPTANYPQLTKDE